MFNRRIIKNALLTITAIALCLPIGRMVVLAQDADSLQIFLPFIQVRTETQSTPPLSQSADAQGPLLFEPETDSVADTDEIGVVRKRQVTVNTDFLDGSLKAGRRQIIGDSIVLNLFADSQYVAKLIHTEPLDDGGYAWIGEIPEIEFSQVTIIVRDDLLTGNIRLPTGLYQLRPSGNELHVISEVDGSAFHETEEDTLPAPDDDTPQLGFDGPTDDGSIIDVMVVYGPDAMRAAGGQVAMENLIDLGFTETNTAYENSGVTYRIRKVHTHQTNYTSSGSGSTDINRLRLPNDGYMDEIHGLRDIYGADLVSLWLESGSCGIGYVNATASSAFSVANRTCATGNLTFGHEIGHNMGGRHDWYVDSNAGPVAYNHGYVHVSDGSGWRTLMAYNAFCNTQGFYCTRLTQVSNPNIMISGFPSGVAEGTNTSCIKGDMNNPPCDAYNAQVFNERAFTVANFRSSTVEEIEPNNPTEVATTVLIPTDIPTDIPTSTPTSTPVDTATPIPTDTPTSTPTSTPVDTATPIPTDTPTNTPTNTPVDTATPIPVPTLTATSVVVVAPIAVSAPVFIVEDFALADIAGSGRVRRTYTRTHNDDNLVQSVRERLGGTNRLNRYNYLKHTWKFDVTGGDSVTFYANAFSSWSRDGDTFIFAYSTDNKNYTELFAVSYTDRYVLKSAPLPDSISGTVYIRVTDSDQSRGTSRRDSVYIDYLSIHSENGLTQ